MGVRRERRNEEKNLVKIILWPYLNSSFLFWGGGGDWVGGYVDTERGLELIHYISQ